MEITIYAKKRKKTDGDTFYTYITKLLRKDGTTQTCTVKFRKECGNPNPYDCPMNIIINKDTCNVATEEYVNENSGEVKIVYSLWISKWEKGSEYVDNSLDEFDFKDE